MRVLLIISILLNIIAANYYEEDRYTEPEEDPCSGESIHWNAPQVNPYEDTLIVTDPYGD